MQPLDFAVKIVSPAFVAGAMEEEVKDTDLFRFVDGKKIKPQHRFIDSDGLRIPSLRGILRFWFRSMNGHRSMNQLKIDESKIFGDTERGQGIRLIPCGASDWTPVKIEKDGQAQGYLGYGPLQYEMKNKGFTSHNKFAFRYAIPPGAVFHFRAIGDEYQITQLEKCLTLLHLFGGIGSRSRRAWGSLEVLGKFILPRDQKENVAVWFEKQLKEVFKDRTLDSKEPEFSAFSKAKASSKASADSICLSKKPLPDYHEVMNEFYQQFKKIRHYKNSGSIGEADHDLEYADYESGKLSGIPQRIAFGMPYHPTARDEKLNMEYEGHPKAANAKPLDRRASPLLLKVFKESNTAFYAVALFLKTASFFRNPGVEFSAKGFAGDLPFPGWKAVEDFMANPNWQSIKLP